MANIIEITDFDAPELDIYARLTEVQLLNRREPGKGMFIAESPLVIERALDAGCVPISFLMETKHAQGKAKQLIERCGNIPVYTAELDVLTQLTGFKLTRGSCPKKSSPSSSAQRATASPPGPSPTATIPFSSRCRTASIR